MLLVWVQWVLKTVSYNRVKGRRHTGEKQISTHPHEPHATMPSTNPCYDKSIATSRVGGLQVQTSRCICKLFYGHAKPSINLNQERRFCLRIFQLLWQLSTVKAPRRLSWSVRATITSSSANVLTSPAARSSHAPTLQTVCLWPSLSVRNVHDLVLAPDQPHLDNFSKFCTAW